LRAFFEGGGFAAQVRQNFSGEMERVMRIGFGFARAISSAAATVEVMEQGNDGEDLRQFSRSVRPFSADFRKKN